MYRALQALGHEPIGFPWHKYFCAASGAPSGIVSLLRRAQNKYLLGPAITRLNADFLDLVAREQPQAVIVYRGTHIYPQTLRQIRAVSPGSVLVGYNNDDPFAPKHFPRLFRFFLAGIPEYDVVFAYRHRNLEDYRIAGARRVELLRSWFVPERNHPVELNSAERDTFGCDVAFVGHYEDDGRVAYLEQIVRRGWKFRLYGPGWDPVIGKSGILSSLTPVRPVWGEDYNKALCGAKIALCFLSKLNRDTYTRRCFEIPATRTMMLSEYSDDLAGMYRQGAEADYFNDIDSMLEKIAHYLGDDNLRQAVAQGGWNRLRADGHDVLSRMQQFIGQIESVGRAKCTN